MESVSGLQLRVAPNSFLQTNTAQAEVGCRKGGYRFELYFCLWAL